jgi:hypothetical protein
MITLTTATMPLGQATLHHSPTDPVLSEFDTVPISASAVRNRTTWDTTQIGQPEQGSSTWRTPLTQVEPTGLCRVTGLDKWEGKIIEIDGEIFTAELFPVDREGMPITASFKLELLGSDAVAVVPGDVFYLSVRTVKAPGMRPELTENLRLRRMGRFTPEEVRAVYEKADALLERLEQLFE